MAVEQRITPEQRQAPRCPVCGAEMVPTPMQPLFDRRMHWWRCPDHREQNSETRDDDADALAGALAERDEAMEAQENAWRNVNLLTRRLSEERVALHEEVARLRAALRNAIDDFAIIFDLSGDEAEPGLSAVQAATKRARAALEPETKGETSND